MRYFSRGWANGELTDDESEAVTRAYEKRLETITPLLPPPVVRLLREVGLHDAIVEKVVWAPARKHLRATFVSGTSVVGYTTVIIDYAGAMLGRERVDGLRRAVSDRDVTVLYQEVDVDETDRSGKLVFVHRLLFHPSEEVTIDCEQMSVSFEERADPRVLLGPAFVVHDESDT